MKKTLRNRDSVVCPPADPPVATARPQVSAAAEASTPTCRSAQCHPLDRQTPRPRLVHTSESAPVTVECTDPISLRRCRQPHTQGVCATPPKPARTARRSSPRRLDEARGDRATVSDADAAFDFYVNKLGWRLDADFGGPDGRQLLQVTPPGSACSVHFGPGVRRLLPARPITSSWSWPTSRPRTLHRAVVVSTSATCSTAFQTGTPSRGVIQTATRTRRSRPSAIRTATPGPCRRSQSGCRAGESRPRRPRRRRERRRTCSTRPPTPRCVRSSRASARLVESARVVPPRGLRRQHV